MKNEVLCLGKLLFLAGVINLTASCSTNEGEVAKTKASWNLSDGVEFPENRPLSRAEDGVVFEDGTLIVADQRYGLAKISLDGKVEPFGDFGAIGYSHAPPEIESGPNGVHFTPDKRFILTADVFSGQIYKTSVESGKTEIIYSHEFGVNTAIQDSSGAIWFTQSTQNNNEERLFGALARPMSDGAVFRIPSSTDSSASNSPELVVEGLNFANGFYIDEVNNKFYLSETLGNRVLTYDLNLSVGSLSNPETLVKLPSPDNMQLNHDGLLWVASPLSNQIYSVNTLDGTADVVFDAQTNVGKAIVEKGLSRVANGKGIVDLIGPDVTGNMPGLLTGMIIGNQNQPFYVANLGQALIKVDLR